MLVELASQLTLKIYWKIDQNLKTGLDFLCAHDKLIILSNNWTQKYNIIIVSCKLILIVIFNATLLPQRGGVILASHQPPDPEPQDQSAGHHGNQDGRTTLWQPAAVGQYLSYICQQFIYNVNILAILHITIMIVCVVPRHMCLTR